MDGNPTRNERYDISTLHHIRDPIAFTWISDIESSEVSLFEVAMFDPDHARDHREIHGTEKGTPPGLSNCITVDLPEGGACIDPTAYASKKQSSGGGTGRTSVTILLSCACWPFYYPLSRPLVERIHACEIYMPIQAYGPGQSVQL